MDFTSLILQMLILSLITQIQLLVANGPCNSKLWWCWDEVLSVVFSLFNYSTLLQKLCMVYLTTLLVSPDIDVNQLVSLREAQLAYRLSDEVVPKK